MATLPQKYDSAQIEKKWQDAWERNGVYHWDESAPRGENYVIDTPPPTVSGLLHMGHVFSYVQADFVARYRRMRGENVFYPMGFDDNGLPTERLVEKVKKIRAHSMPREEFIKICEDVSREARQAFRSLFTSVALSVDWRQEYHTISAESRALSQMSFLDLLRKGHAYRRLQPMFWDTVDRTAIAQAETEDKELASHFCDVAFTVRETGERVVIGTTRPELLGACVAVFYHPNDARYAHLAGKNAVTALFGAIVPFIADDAVKIDKGTGLVMCCTFGDETDVTWKQKYDLPYRIIVGKDGKLTHMEGIGRAHPCTGVAWPCVDIATADRYIEQLQGFKVEDARAKTIALLEEDGALLKKEPIVHAVKCAERSGAPLEILPTEQWFVKILDHKDALKSKADEITWRPAFMKKRLEQWIDGLSWDWCVSRQRYYGVPFPVWYVRKLSPEVPIERTPITHPDGSQEYVINAPDDFFTTQWELVAAHESQLPVNPIGSLPKGFRILTAEEKQFVARRYTEIALPLPEALKPDSITARAKEDIISIDGRIIFKKDDYVEVEPDTDVMDTWATSSVSPQLNARGITEQLCVDATRFGQLYPADLRPQAHEIIRTWAFYSIVKSYLHSDGAPWKDVMISGWCLAADKTKMSKSKGNVVTPEELVRTMGADVVRYWASTSRLGADTAYSEDVLKIGKKLTGKLFNAAKFASMQFKDGMAPTTIKNDVASGAIFCALDKWALSRLKETIEKAQEAFDRFEYCEARVHIEDFFWNVFCDNYLELAKVRAYGEAEGLDARASLSASLTFYHCVETALRLFAPFLPHLCEELYAGLFAEDGRLRGASIHARGNWPNAEDGFCDEKSLQSGEAAVAVIEAVRKMKAEKGVSIKWPLDALYIQNAALKATLGDATKDVAFAANAARVAFGQVPDEKSALRQDGVAAIFGAESDKEAVA